VLVEEGGSVKKGQPLFQFDRRPHEYKVQQLEAQLAEAKQNIGVLKADMDAAAQKQGGLKLQLAHAQYQKRIFDKLVSEGAGREEDAIDMATRVGVAITAEKAALAELERLRYESEINERMLKLK
jgi:multidrug resistance efflux pump